jgi:hypothetical protein
MVGLAGLALAVLLVGCGVSDAARPACDGVSEALCHAAHTVAEMHGLFLQPGQHVVSWTVRPSAAKACAETGPARADVKFKIDPPPGFVTVTVAETSNGALAVCLY